MNILIVNAFGKTKSGEQSFKTICKIIDDLFHKVAFKSGIENFYYTYRNVEELEDFVYNYPENKKATLQKIQEFKKNFEKLDFVFIEGLEKKYLPWSKEGLKLQYLIKLCEETKKNLYAGGIGMLHLLYYLATNGNYKNFINSNGDFPCIEDLDKIPYDYLMNLKGEDAFLDFATGDVYKFNNEEWTPIMNIGIHKLIYAEKFKNRRGKFVLKDFKLNKNPELISCRKKEIKCKIIKQYCLHYLVKNIPVEFVAYTSLTWFQHNFNVNNLKLQYKTIYDSNFGSVVIEHCNSVGNIFHILKNYPETISLLENFIRKKFYEVHTKNIVFIRDKQPEDPFYSEEAKKLFACVVREKPIDKQSGVTQNCLNPKSTENLVNKSRFFYHITKDENEGKHCGISYNNHDMIFVENNSVFKKVLQMSENAKNIESNVFRPEKLTINEILGDDYDYLNPDPKWDDDKIIEYYKKKGREICSRLEEFKETDQDKENKLTKINLNNSKKRPKTGSFSSSSSIYSSKKSSQSLTSRASLSSTLTKNSITKSSVNQSLSSNKKLINKTENNKLPTFPRNSKSKDFLTININNTNSERINQRFNSDVNEGVLTFLFPYINEEDFKRKTFTEGRNKNSNLKVVRINQERRIKSNFNKKYKKYDKELNTFRDKPSIRCSSDYITEDEARRREFIESKKQWMIPEDFHRVFGKRTNQLREKAEKDKNSPKEYIPNIYQTFVLGYQFRPSDKNKSKWMSKRDFIV